MECGSVGELRQTNPTFEHEHEDDFDAPFQGGRFWYRAPGVKTPS
jgi:hypothetical protein